MNDVSTCMLEEYKSIRGEIYDKISLTNDLIKFTITTVIAILSFAFICYKQVGSNTIFLLLVPYFIILPMSVRVLYYRRATVKLATYENVFLEPLLAGLNWERRNNDLAELFANPDDLSNVGLRDYKEKLILKNNEFFYLGLICYFIYVFVFVMEYVKHWSNIYYLSIILPVIAVLSEAYITYIINKIDDEKVDLITLWVDLKTKERIWGTSRNHH